MPFSKLASPVKIQKLKIVGFKSFAQRVEVQFEGNGLTAIVGPNGAGKSNIVDAIRWVMGEQKASSLRMDKMQGVIFSGTEERPAMSMAEVSLIIENDRGLFPSEYSEVMITRRAFSNGDSEYLINNQDCRLADIRNLFADTGMGANSYSQMDQRMVDALLSDKADERRAIFEEAAGVSKYKKQRKEAASHLERVQKEMESIAMKLQYEKRQFREHEKMLDRTQEFHKLKKRLKEIDVSISIVKYTQEKTSLRSLSTAKLNGDAELETLKTKLTELETKIEEKRLLIASDEENLRDSEREVSNTATEIATLNEAYKHLQNRGRELGENSERCEREIEENSKRILALKDEMQSLESELKNASPEIEDIESKRAKENEILQGLKSSVESLRIRHRELSNKRLRTVQAEGELKGLRQKTDAEIDILEKQISGARHEIQNFDSQIEEFEKLKESKENEAAKNKNESETLQEKQTVLANEKETLRETESRLEALQKVTKTGDLEGNKWILSEKAAEGAVLLFSQIEVLDSKHSALVEFCLGSSAQAILMQNPSAVLECARSLNSNNLGRALLAWNSNSYKENAALNEPGVTPVSSLVKHNENSGGLIKSLLSKYFLASSLEKAAELAQSYAGKDLWFCTEDCQAVSAMGLAVVGKGQETIKSSLAETKRKLGEIDSSIASVAEEKQAADSNAAKANSEAQLARANIHALKTQKEKTEQNISNFETRLQELKDSKNTSTDLNTAELKLELVEREFEIIDTELAEQERILKNSEEQASKLAGSLSEKRAVFSQKENRLRFVKEQIQTLNNTLVLRNDELETIEGKKKSLERELESKALQIEKQQELLCSKEKLRDEAREKYNVIAGDIEEWRSEVREINKALREKEKVSHETELAMQGCHASLESVRERIYREYEFDLELEPGAQGFEPISIEERAASIEIRELNEKIREIGPINSNAAEDLEAERERVLSIEAQLNDLNNANNSLSLAIERLDLVARDRFLDTFRKIQRNYQDVFSSLMPGGEALLYMQSDIDPLEAEIEINARPTGKKMRGVRALSGGERALTATSLLFALYMVKPSPYCILDEIDGPLDDANIGRFLALLRRFSHQTQFVVITHNKRTMAGCDMLYGVSQEIKGISKIGSIRLEDVPD